MGDRTICWFSCGAASAVATKLTLTDNPEAIIAYCETGSDHPDNDRFLADCEAWFGAPIQRLSNPEYVDTWHVWEDRRYIAGIAGAPCTAALKKQPRIAFQRPDDMHVFGYTADANDIVRALRLRKHQPEMDIQTPLIERGINKSACLALIESAGIALPPMYALGFQNNNCIPCPKATSPDYWALMRQEFPEQFGRMARLSRDLGARLARTGSERIFIDEVPADQPTTNPIAPACDFLCHIAEQD